MKLVILDAYTLNPGDLSWDELKSLADCDIYDRTPPELVLERARDAEIVLTNKTVLDADTIAQLPKLAYIGVLATGYNVVDLDAASKAGIPVTNIPAYGTPAVAQMVFAHILNLTHHVCQHSKTVRDGQWSTCDDFCYWNFPLIELLDSTLGIVGFGRIGQQVARIAAAFGMNILVHTEPVCETDLPVEFVDLDRLFAESDFITLHCPLTEKTENMVDHTHIGMMKPTAFIINTGRGPLVDEDALAEALDNNTIAGAGLDVLSTEPPDADNPLLHAKNCYVTPHIAWATKAARSRLLNTAVANVKAFIAGTSQNVVNR